MRRHVMPLLRTLYTLVHGLYTHPKICFLVGVLHALWVLQGLPIQAAETSRAPFVLVGHLKSEKNHMAAALLGVGERWREAFGGRSNDFHVRITQKEKQKVIDTFGAPLLELYPNFWRRTQEKTVFYDHKDLSCPFYNLQGFGETGVASLFQSDLNTKGAQKSFKKIQKQPIKGLVLHIRLSHLHGSVNKPSLNVMDFVLPYFKDAEAIKQYLAPSVCLVITGFGSDLHVYEDDEKSKQRAFRSLRRSMRTCYTAFYQADEGTEAYFTLAKQKALYDIFLQNPEKITPDENQRFDLNDFDLNFDKIITFHTRRPMFYPVEKSAQKIRDAVASFQGIAPSVFGYGAPPESNMPSLLWGVPVAVGVGYAWSRSDEKDVPQGKTKKSTKRDKARKRVSSEREDAHALHEQA